MAVRNVLKWLVVILLLVAVGGAGGLYWFWTRSDELLRQAILAKCAEMAPTWNVQIGKARFDWNRQVRLSDVTIRTDPRSEPIVSSDIVVNINRDKLADSQQIEVHKIRFIKPRLNLIRDASGRWNWQDLLPLKESTHACPDIEIDAAVVSIHLQHGGGNPPASFVVRDGDFKFTPTGKRRYLVKGSLQIERLGSLTVSCQWDIDKKTWTIDGHLQDVALNTELASLAASASPELRTRLAQWDARLKTFGQLTDQHRPGNVRQPYQVVSRPQPGEVGNPLVRPAVPRPIVSNGISDLGIDGTADVHFRVSRWDSETDLEFQMLAQIHQVRITNRALPFPLHGVEGTLFWNNRQFLIRNMTATNGITGLKLDARIHREGASSPGRFDVNVSNLVLDNRLRNRLPASWRKLYDSIRPTGRVDVRGTLHHDGQGRWRPEGFLLTARDCTSTHTKFPYPITAVQGTIQQQGEHGELLEFRFEGRAGRQPVTLVGMTKNPGPAAESSFDIHVDQLPLDETFLAACAPETRRTLTTLKLKGLANLQLHLYRPAGLNRRFQPDLTAELNHGSLEYVWFPYRLSNLSGTVTYKSATKTWSFPDLKAVHGTAQVNGFGTFSKRTEPGRLRLTIDTKGAHFDRQLELALPAHLQRLWDELSPAGRLNVLTKIDWIPGRPADVSLPDVRIFDASLLLKAFPVPLDDVRAQLSYANGIVTVASLTARHDDTQFRANGFAQYYPKGDWRIRIDELFADDLVPDRLFRRALPPELRTVIDELNPRGPLSLSGMLEFKGTDRDGVPITAAWDLKSVLTNETVNAGVELKNIHGTVTTRGKWDGRQLKEVHGNIDLASVNVLDHQLTQVRGPYRVTYRGNDLQLIVGSEAVLGPNSRRIDPSKRVTAKAIGGQLTLDGTVLLKEQPTYQLLVTLSDGKLEQYARRYMRGARNFRGIMNGWVNLRGNGSSEKQLSGRGQLQISPAALYELPIMVQIFKVLTPTAPDNSAFRYALLDFKLGGGRFDFDRIDLVGEPISLRGRGTARFDGQLKLDFYSMLSRNQIPIPILNVILGQATKGWVGVQIRGNVGDPVATIKAVPTIDEALKRFLGAFDARPKSNMPRLSVPPVRPLLIKPPPRRPR